MEPLASRNTSAPGGPIGTVHYIYDTQGHLIAEADAATGATTREYLWLPSNDNQNDTMAEDMGLAANDNAPVDLPLAVVNVSATPVIYQVHTDQLGRPIRMTDAAKATIWQATWKPWGEVQSITGTVANNLRFPGQYFQVETGLAYNWHRTYDPVTGRYTQPDPLRFVDGPAIYQYAMASPFMRVDREGLTNTPWPGNGGVINDSGGPVTVYGDDDGGNWITKTVPSGKRSPRGGWRNTQDWDFVMVGCNCYRIPAWHEVYIPEIGLPHNQHSPSAQHSPIPIPQIGPFDPGSDQDLCRQLRDKIKKGTVR
jgi:RHS repeat-associated protein